MHAVVGGEIEIVVHHHKARWGARVGARTNVKSPFNIGTVCAPEFVAINTIIGVEVHPVAEDCEIVGACTIGPNMGVAHQLCADAVGTPDFVAVRGIKRTEVDVRAESDGVRRPRTPRTSFNIVDHANHERGGINPPQLVTIYAVGCSEVERVTDTDEWYRVTPIGACIDVIDEFCCCAIGSPEFAPVVSITRAVIDPAVVAQQILRSASAVGEYHVGRVTIRAIEPAERTEKDVVAQHDRIRIVHGVGAPRAGEEVNDRKGWRRG